MRLVKYPDCWRLRQLAQDLIDLIERFPGMRDHESATRLTMAGITEAGSIGK